jgi:hypothetical protein
MFHRLKLLLAILAAGLASRTLAAAPVPAEVTSPEALKAAGVICRRIELQALTASAEIDVRVDENRFAGTYGKAECVVLKEPLAEGKLAALDAAAADGAPVARRAQSAKPSAAFLVLGREIPRAYLAIEFSVADDAGHAVAHRYLLPVSAVREAPAEPAPEPADPARSALLRP